MKHTINPRRAALAAALLLPVTFAFNSAGTSISFAPEEGLSLTKSYQHQMDAHLVAVEARQNDETMEIDDIPELGFSSTENIVFLDTYTEVGEGRPTVLERHFSELERTRDQSGPDGDGGTSETSTEEASELLDLVVIYTWDGDEEAYSASYGDDVEGGDEDLLEDTKCDVDFLGFLPDGDVDEGDSWEVDIEAWILVVEPGGDLTFIADDEDGDESDEIDEEITESLEGEIECTYKGTREEDGRNLAVIEVTVDIGGSGDSEEDIDAEVEHIETLTKTREIEVAIEFEGELLWDLDAGHMYSFTAAGESEITINESMAFELADGQSFTQGQLMTFESEREIDITFE